MSPTDKLFSTNYFGSIPYFQVLAQKKELIFDIHEQYKKQTWRNRALILESNGPMYLTIPVTRPNGSKTLVKDVSIEYKEDWRKDHWMAIKSSYTHAPYFFYYGDQVKELIYQQEDVLYKFNHHIFLKLAEWLDLEIASSFTENYIPPLDKNDNRIGLGVKTFEKEQRKYIQVFSDKLPFYSNLSILDLLMNEGPLARNYLIPR